MGLGTKHCSWSLKTQGSDAAQPVTFHVIVKKLLCPWVKWAWQVLAGLPYRTTTVAMQLPGQLSCARGGAGGCCHCWYYG